MLFTDKTFLKALPFDVAAIQMKLICFLQLAFRPPSDLAEMVLHVHVKLTIQDDAIQILQSKEITDPKWVVNNFFLNYESPHVIASQGVGRHSYLHWITIESPAMVHLPMVIFKTPKTPLKPGFTHDQTEKSRYNHFRD